MDSFRPVLSFERRQDDVKMFMLRLASAAALTFFVLQLAKEPENLDNLASFTNENINDLFNWGNDRFVLGQLPSQSGNSTLKRKKSPQEVFMEAILETEEETTTAEDETTTTTTNEDEEHTAANSDSDTEPNKESEVDAEQEEREAAEVKQGEEKHAKLDIDTLGLVDEEEEEFNVHAEQKEQETVT
jgi:hypothetical protein